jgi:hypothetical protein
MTESDQNGTHAPVDDKMQKFISSQFAQIDQWLANAPTEATIKSVKTSTLIALRINADSLVQSLPLLTQGQPFDSMRGYMQQLGDVAKLCDAEIDFRIPVKD